MHTCYLLIHCIGDTATRRPVTGCREFDRTGTVYYRLQLLRHWLYFFLLSFVGWFAFAPAHQILSRWFRLTSWFRCWRWKQHLLQLAPVWRACKTFSMTDTMFLCIRWMLLVWQWNQIMKRRERSRSCWLYIIASVFLLRVRVRICCAFVFALSVATEYRHGLVPGSKSLLPIPAISHVKTVQIYIALPCVVHFHSILAIICW